MSKLDNPVVLLLTLAVTFGLSVAGIGWAYQFGFGFNSAIENKSETKTENTSAKKHLLVLGDSFSGYSTFRSAAFSEAVKEIGFNLRYENELDQTKRAERLNQGEADLLLTSLDQFLKHKPDGKIIGLIGRTVGADAVVLNTKKYPNLKSLVDLTQLLQEAREKGQPLTISFAGDTASEYLAWVLSSKFEAFKLSDFQIDIVADASVAWKKLQDPNQNVAVAVIWEPYVTQARQQGYKVVLSSKDEPEAILNVIVASNRLIQSQPDKIAELLAAYYRRIDAGIRDASLLQKQIAKDGKLSPSDATAVLQGIDFFTSVQAKNWLTDETLNKRIDSTAAVLTLAAKITQVPQNPRELYSAEFIAKAAESTQNLINLVHADNPDLAKKLEGKNATGLTPNSQPLEGATDIGNLQVEGDVRFATDSANLTEEGKQTLNKVAQKLTGLNQETVAIRVIGHTSKFGDADFNQTVSQQRAETVANYLRDRSVKLKIEAVGKGGQQPLPNIDPEDKRNQRTEIRLVRFS
ncbi:MAG: phosphate ABC transporter substrate-binding/OmpA family protein [Gloeotrichia echinulata CP02]